MGKLISGIFGMDSGTKQSGAGIAAGERYAKDITFKPVTIASTLASMTGSPTGEYSGAMQPQLLGISQDVLGGAEKLYGTLKDFDVGSVAQQLYQQEYEMLKPTLAAQQVQAQERMFGGGRLGLKLAGEGAGAGMGMVQPDAYGLGAAQSQMLGQLALGARERAFGEAMQTGKLASGMLGTAMGIEEMAQKLIALGVEAQSARSAAAAAAGQVGTSGYTMATQAAMGQDRSMGSFWGGLFGGIGAAKGVGSFFSDISLKENIELKGILPNGLSWYTWTWNDIAKKLGADKQPSEGVMAQEVMSVIPDAVSTNKDGYYVVDYSKVLEA